MTPGSFKRIFFTLILALSAIGLAQSVPNPTTSQVSDTGDLIGRTISVPIGFENPTPSKTGYEPFFWIWVPETGPNANQPSGIEFSSFGMFDEEGLNAVEYKYDGDSYSPNLPAWLTDANDPDVNLAFNPSGEAGTFVFIKPPLGSFTPGQSAVDVHADFEILTTAVPENYPIAYGSGFRYGADPTGGDPVFEEPKDFNIKPDVAVVTKSFENYDHLGGYETAIGPSFTREYTLTTRIAKEQLVDGINLVDLLPNDLVLVGDFKFSNNNNRGTIDDVAIRLTGTIKDGGGQEQQIDLTGQALAGALPVGPGKDMELSFSVPNAQSAPTEEEVISITFSAYVPPLNYNGNPVGARRGHTENKVELAGDWANPYYPNGYDVEDSDQISIKLLSNEGGSSDNSIITIKKTLNSDSQVGEVLPGENLDFTIEIEVSDTSAYADLVVYDFFEDGLEFDSNKPVTLTWESVHGSNTTGVSITPSPIDGTALTDMLDADGDDREKTIENLDNVSAYSFDISGNLTGDLASGKVLGGCVEESGGLTDCDVLGATGTTLTLTYSAKVLDTYRRTLNDNVTQTDTFGNVAWIDATTLDVESLDPAASEHQREVWDDYTRVDLSVNGTTPHKVLSHINGDSQIGSQSDPIVAPGDKVTFLLHLELTTPDINHFVVTDYLPVPAFLARDFTFDSPDLNNTAIPAVNHAKFTKIDIDSAGATPSWTHIAELGDLVPGFDTQPVSVDKDADKNSLIFDIGTRRSEANEKVFLQIAFTIEVEDERMLDELILANRIYQEEQDSTGSETSSSSTIRQLTISRPVLNITNGVVDVTNSRINIDPERYDPGTTKVISEDNRGDFQDDQGDLDGSDTVTFAAIVENTGLGVHGAHGLQVDVSLPTLSSELGADASFTSNPNVRLYYGDGSSAQDDFDISTINNGDTTFTISAKAGEGVLERGRQKVDGTLNKDGDNILVILYDVNVPKDAPMARNYQANAEITEYYAFEGASENLAVGPGLTAEAFISTRIPVPTKSIATTSEEFTADEDGNNDGIYPRPVAIGEVIRYRIEFEVPEGDHKGAWLQDDFPTDNLQYLGQLTTGLIGSPGNAIVDLAHSDSGDCEVGTGVSTTRPASGLLFCAIDLHNSNTDNGVVKGFVEFDALVLNSTANTIGGTVQNRARFVAPADGSGQTGTYSSWTGAVIVEPNIDVTKTVTDGTAPFSAGDTLTFEIEIENKSGTNVTKAWDMTFTDEVPSEFSIGSSVTAVHSDAGITLTTTTTGQIVSIDGTFDLGVGEKVTVKIPVTVLDTARTSDKVTNTAEVISTSLPGEKGSYPNSGSIGDPDTSTGERVVTTTGSVDVDIISPELVKSIVDHSDTAVTPTVDEVVIGEVITYRLRTTVPRATTENIVITDTLPAGLEFVTGSAYGIVVAEHTDNNWTYTPVAGGQELHEVSTYDADDLLKVVYTNDASLTPDKDGQKLSFSVGTIVNDIDNQVDEFIVIEFDAIVVDVPSNIDGTELSNQFSVSHGPDTNNPIDTEHSEPVTTTVVLPKLDVNKVASLPTPLADTDAQLDSVTNPTEIMGLDRGEEFEFTVTIKNTGSVDSYYLDITDTLPDHLEFAGTYSDLTDINFTGHTGFDGDWSATVTTDTTNNKISIEFAETSNPPILPVDKAVTFTYKVRVKSGAEAGDSDDNQVVADTWTVSNKGNARKVTGEDEFTVTVGTPELQVDKTMTEVSFDGYDTYKLEAEITLTNVGNLRVENLSLVENLKKAFTFNNADVILASIDDVTITTVDEDDTSVNRGLTVHDDFDDLDDATWEVFGNPASPGDGIVHVNDVVTVKIEFTVIATKVAQLLDGNDPVEYTNTVVAKAESIGGLEAEEVEKSADITLTYEPELSIEKTASPANPVSPNDDGTYTVTYTFTVKNDGNVHLRKFALEDEFLDALDGNFSVVPPIVLGNLSGPASGSIALNNGVYNGDGVTALLDTSSQELKATESFTFDMTVVLQPEAGMSGVSGAHITNTVEGTGETLDKTIKDDDTAEVTFDIPEPTFDLSKTAGTPTFDGVSVYTVPFTITATNTSDTKIDRFNITEDLEEALGTTFPAAVSGISNTTITFSGTGAGTMADFTGETTSAKGRIKLFDTDVALEKNETVTVQFTATFTLTGIPDWESVTDGDFEFTNEISAKAETIIGGKYEGEAEDAFTLRYNPVLDASKSLVNGSVIHHASGDHEVAFDIEFTNTGNVDLQGFQITDLLGDVLGTENFYAQVTVGTGSDVDADAFASDLISGRAYTDTNQFNGQFLDPTITLEPGKTVQFNLQIKNYTPDNWDGTEYTELKNIVTGNAEHGPDGVTKEPITEDAEAHFKPTEDPKITVTKSALPPAPVYQSPDAGYDINFSITVTNTGNVDLHDLSVTEDLEEALGVTIFDTPVVTFNPTTIGKNDDWNGIDKTELIADGQTLAAGDDLVITIELTGVQIPDNNTKADNALIDSRTNTVEVSGEAPIKRTVENDAEATFTPVDNAGISVIKTAAINPVDGTDDTFTIHLTFDITNDGPVTLTDIELFDDLRTLPSSVSGKTLSDIVDFSNPALAFSAENIPGDFAYNDDYQEAGDYNLLATGQNLDPGASRSITLRIDNAKLIDADTEGTSALNQAEVKGTAHGRKVTNTSHNGVTAGPNDPTPLELNSPNLDKYFVDTNGVSSKDPIEVRIGDTITYRLVVELKEHGTYNGLTISDTLPDALRLDGDIQKLEYNAAQPDTVLTNDFDGTATISGDLANGIALGDYVLGAGDSRFIYVQFDAIVEDDDANSAFDTALETKENLFSISYTNMGTTSNLDSNTIRADIIEPVLDLTKAVTGLQTGSQGTITNDGDAENIDIGEELTYTITITNNGTGPAYWLVVTDDFDPGLSFDSVVSAKIETTDVDVTATPDTTNSTVEFALDNDDELAVGESLVIEYLVTVNDNVGNVSGAELENSAEATGQSTEDPNNDDNRTTTSNDDSATTKLAEPTISVEKTATVTEYDGANTFTVEFGFTVTNTGPINVNRVELIDELPFNESDVKSAVVTVPGDWTEATGAPVYDGYAEQTLFTGTFNDVLSPTDTSSELTLTVIVELDNIDDLNEYTNTVEATGRTPGGDGLETPEADDDAEFTPLDLYDPRVEITKSATDPVNNGDGSYTTKYTITVTNTGSATTGVDLVNPQVTDNLSDTFADAASFTVDSATAEHSDATDLTGMLVGIDSSTGTFTSTELFDYSGTDTITLKRPANAGDDGESLTITFEVTFRPEPGATNDEYINVASTSTNSPFENGDPIEDDSDEVKITYDEKPLLGVSTSYDENNTVDHLDGSYTITLEVDLRNYGKTSDDGVQLDNISVPFDLDEFFQGAAHFEFVPGSLKSTNGFVINPNYDGVTDTELLVPSGDDVLYADGQTGLNAETLTLKVFIVPGNKLYYEASTTAEATTPLGRDTSDESNDGGDPDGGGGPTDGDPTNNTAPTPIPFADEPAIGLAKEFVEGSLKGTGTPGEFELQFAFVMQNHGKSQLNDVSLLEDFTDVFGPNSPWEVTAITATAPLAAATAPITQTTNTINLLDSTNSTLGTAAQAELDLLPDTAEVLVTIVVTPEHPELEHYNLGISQGTSPADNDSEGPSYDGTTPWDPTDPDAPDNEQDPGEPGNPTPFRFERPDIAVTKTATTEIRPDGQMDVHYTFTIQNTGDVDLHDVQLTDNLADALGAGNYTLMSLYSTTLTVNALAPVSGGYDGETNINLLTGTDTIATGEWYAEPIKAGAEHTVNLHVRVKNPDAAGATNTANAYGVSPALNPVDDEAKHTVFPAEDPQIALAKSATVDLQSDGTFNVDYRFVVKNVGDVQLSNVQIIEDFQDLYASTDLTANKISRVYSELTYNTSFTGNTDPNLLTGVDTLEVGQEKTIIIRLSGITANHAGDIRNSALATGEGPYGGKTNDRSNDGLTPEPGEDVPTKINLTPKTQIAIAKHSASELRTDGTYDVTFTLNVANVGNSKLLGVQVRDTLEDFYAKTNLTASNISVSSSDFAVNSAFDGANDPDLLLGTDTLGVGASGVITIKLAQLTPNAGVTEAGNIAVATGRDATGKRTTDKSNDGVTPEPGNDTPTVTPLTPQPQIGIAKQAGVTLKSDGTYTAVFDLVLQNYGNTVIHNVQVTDDLAAFYSEASLSASNISVSATGLSVNSGYNGQSDQNLLTGTDTLDLTETKTITITLTGLVVTPPKTILNTAIATGTDPSGQYPTEDRSTDGDNPDPDNDGDPTNNDDPTPVDFDENPLLGLAKDATVEPGSATGSFKITFEILVKNYGNTDLVDLQVTDPMWDDLLSLAQSYAPPVVTSTDFTVNTNYNGHSEFNLLAGTDVLPVDGEGIITIVIDNFVPKPAFSRGENSALGSGTPPTKPGETPKPPVEDTSQNGKDPDPDNDGDPTNNDDPTPVDFTVDPPVVGIAKAAEVTEHGDGTFDVTLLFTVKNYSKEDADNIQIRDNLTDLYAQTTVDASAITVSSSDFTVNASFDGFTDVHVLAGTDTLVAGASGTATVFIEGIRATGDKVEVFNTAIVTGTDPRTGRPITPDESTNGEDPDPDGDGDPHNNNDPTPILVHVAPKIGLAKAATVTAKGDGVHDITFTIRAVNYGDTELTNVSITDSLAEFYARTNLTPAQVSVSSTTFTTNPLYDGQTDTELLGTGNSLKVGGEGTVSITLTDVIPASDVTRLYNSAFTTAEAPGGRTVDDTSHNGDDPDPSGTNRPGDHNDPTPVDFTPVGSVLLEKQADKGNYEIGDKITYTITVSNPHDVAISFTLLDTIPTHTTYITGSTVFNDDALVPLDGKEPRQKDYETLEWRSILLPAGKVLTITYDLRILPGANGDLTNVVTIDGEDENNKRFTDRTTETVKVSRGIFDREKSTLIGRVFIDVNNNTIYDEGIDIPVENARVILANGWQTTTDAQGNYAFRNIDTGTWSVQLDERTAPYPTQRHPEQLRDKYQHRVSVSGLTVSDFPLIGVIGDIETDRETFVTFGPLTLHKYIVTGDEADTAVLTISTTEDLPAAILVTDPQPDGTITTYVVEPSAGAASTITYDLPLGSQLTDPILEWSEQ